MQRTRRVKGLEGRHVNSKSPSRVRDGNEGVTERNYSVSSQGVIDLPSNQIIVFYLSGPLNVCLLATPLLSCFPHKKRTFHNVLKSQGAVSIVVLSHKPTQYFWLFKIPSTIFLNIFKKESTYLALTSGE